MVDNMERIEELKQDLTVEQLSCMEVIKCRSHQPTLLCVMNASQLSKRHFCEMVNQQDVVISFFKWVVNDILKPTNSCRDQKNDCVFVAHNGSAYDSQFLYRNAHKFFGSRNVNVLIHNNRMIELKIQVNTRFQMAMVFFKDSYKFINLPLCSLPKSFGFQNELQKGFFLTTLIQRETCTIRVVYLE